MVKIVRVRKTVVGDRHSPQPERLVSHLQSKRAMVLRQIILSSIWILYLRNAKATYVICEICEDQTVFLQ